MMVQQQSNHAHGAGFHYGATHYDESCHSGDNRHDAEYIMNHDGDKCYQNDGIRDHHDDVVENHLQCAKS